MDNLVRCKAENGQATVYLSGHIDSGNAPAVEAEITRLLGEVAYTQLVIDGETLEYISSAGLRIILKLIKSNRDLLFVNATAEVYDVLEMTGFTEMITVKKAYRRMDITGCEAIAQGANGKVYRIDPETIIKVYLNPDSLPDIHRERELARSAFVHGIPTAISYDVVKVDDGYGSVFEMLNAKSIAKCLAEEPEEIDKYAHVYIDLLHQIHGTHLKPGEMPDMKAVAVDWAHFMEDYLPETAGKKLSALVAAVPERDTMIHGDYHVRNVMLQDGEPLLIDMDTLSMGHPVFELASMYLAYVGFGIIDPGEVERFMKIPADTCRRFWERSLALYLGTDDPEAARTAEEKASLIGLTRLARRTIRRNGLNTPEGKKLIDACIVRISELTEKLDTLEL